MNSLIEQLVDILGLSRKELVKKYLRYRATCFQEDSWYYIKGHRHPEVLLVSHIDKVHDKQSIKIVYDKTAKIQDMLIWSPDILGADDRAGVFGCLCLNVNKGVSCLFCDGEEKGGIGASEFVRSPEAKKILKDVKVLIELDKAGTMVFSVYREQDPRFVDFWKKQGFNQVHGSFSDITFLGRDFDIASINLSVGYKNQHTSSEHLSVGGLFRTLSALADILDHKYKELLGACVPPPKPALCKKDVDRIRWNDYDSSWIYRNYYGYTGDEEVEEESVVEDMMSFYQEDMPKKMAEDQKFIQYLYEKCWYEPEWVDSFATQDYIDWDSVYAIYEEEMEIDGREREQGGESSDEKERLPQDSPE